MGKWRRHERETMRALGLRPTALSGAGWIEKEDGENEHLLAQLKSTEGKQIAVRKIDLDDLAHHARVARKLPIFVLSWPGEEPWIMARASQLKKVSKYVAEAEDTDSGYSNSLPVSRTDDKEARFHRTTLRRRRAGHSGG